MYARVITRSMWGIALAAILALHAMNLTRGELNQDEGWYLYGARLVAEGQLPYVDFATTQGPVMPFVYALGNPLVTAFGVAGGRLFTALLSLCGLAAAMWLARRLVKTEPATAADGSADAGAFASLAVLLLLGVNVYQNYFCTIVKTYALTGLLITLAMVTLTYVTRGRRWPAFLAGLLMMLAAGTRASAFFPIPVIVVLLGWRASRRPREGDAAGWGVPVAFLAGVCVTGLAIFLPFLIKAPQALWFAMVEYHTGREAGGLTSTIAYKVAFLSRLSLAYGAAAVAAIVVAVVRGTRAKVAERRDRPVLTVMLVSIAVLSLVHMGAPFPYDDYQVLVYPLLAVVLAVTLPRWQGGGPVLVGLFLVVMAMALASPINQSWFAGQRDRIWWPLRESPPLRVLQQTADRMIEAGWIRPGDVLLTQDPYLAVEGGFVLPQGLEMGQFSYFPDWSLEKADVCHVLNRESFRALLSSNKATCAAFSGYGLTIRSPEVMPLEATETDALRALVNAHFQTVERVHPFGQADTTLEILVRRPDA